MWTLIPKVGWCLPGFSTIKSLFFPLVINKSLRRHCEVGQRSCLPCDFSTVHFRVRALAPSNLLSIRSQHCCFLVMLGLSSSHRRLEGINTHAVDVPGMTVAGGQHCFYLCREEVVLRASNLSKCTFPNEHLYFFALVSWKRHWTGWRKGDWGPVCFWQSLAVWPWARNLSSLDLGCPKGEGFILDNSWGDFQLLTFCGRIVGCPPGLSLYL